MRCLECGATTEVLDTRISVEGVKRRRRCFNMHVFKTLEVRCDEDNEQTQSATDDHERLGAATVQQGQGTYLLYRAFKQPSNRPA